MVSLIVIFWMYVILFAVIGAMRGWARELLVSFSVILAIFIIALLQNFVPFIRNILAANGEVWFWVRSGLTGALVFFGYQSPNIPRLSANNKFARDRVQDILLGFFLGALNGYLIAGTMWFFLDNSGYPFVNIISAPQPGTTVFEATQRMMAMMPPQLLGASSAIYFAVALAFVFILVVFI